MYSHNCALVILDFEGRAIVEAAIHGNDDFLLYLTVTMKSDGILPLMKRND